MKEQHFHDHDRDPAVDQCELKVLEAQITTANGIGSAEPRRIRRYRLVSGLAASVAMAVGALVVVGWLSGIRILRTIIPDYATIKPNTAFCFVLAGLSLYLCGVRQVKPARFTPWTDGWDNYARYW